MGPVRAAEQKVRVSRTFDEVAGSWGAHYAAQRGFRGANLRQRRDEVLGRLMSDLQGGRVLDLGCGAGDYLLELMHAGFEVWGLDGSAAMIACARERFSQDASPMLHLDTGDAEGMPYGEATFDGVVCAGTLEYLPRDGQALAEIYRVLRPGGTGVLTIPNRWSPFMIMDHVGLRVVRAGGWVLQAFGIFEAVRKKPRATTTIAHRACTPSRFKQALRTAGFKIIEAGYLGYGSGLLNDRVPGAGAVSRVLYRLRRHRLIGPLGATFVVKVRKP